ncbi:hypothetical protein HMPREF9555_00896 [Selenomonas artemidis F0399]|uniref:Uncharacterized protein n=1 Tax=Selenomonas artemidis F0399 TaxID=749551 RepID=E7N1R2_9FIRM|nr:hypothetical protein HMPREF9555_00896 [Selenomonas artemidis F0399]EJP31098.1 hypothetical protein HMPREF1147_0063 [Selenomonas sp. FOBRC9]
MLTHRMASEKPAPHVVQDGLPISSLSSHLIRSLGCAGFSF